MHRRSETILIAVLALAVFVAGVWIALTLLEGIPHVSDAIAYAFQAKIFASGQITLTPPPLPELFEQGHVIVTGSTWSGKYPPGWPLLLAAGYLIAAPWIINPLLTALSVILVWRLGRELFDVPTGIVAAVILSISPAFVLMSGDQMAHPAALTFSLATLLAIVRAAAGGRTSTAALAGLLAGVTCLIRPYTGLVLLWPAFVWLLWQQREAKKRLITAVVVVAAALPALAVYLGFNAYVFGNPLEAGYNLSNPSDGLNSFSLQATLGNIPLWWERLNQRMWGWPWPDLLIFLPLLIRRPGRGRDLMLGACAVSLVAAHAPYFFFDIIYGIARYAFEALGPLAILAARSLLTLKSVVDRMVARWPGRWLRFAGTVAVAVVAGATAVFPLARTIRQEIPYHRQHYHGITRAAVDAAEAAGVVEKALIFVDSPSYHYGSYFLENALNPSAGGRVWIRDIEALRDAARKTFPRPEAWRLHVELAPLRGPNVYAEAFTIAELRWERLAAVPTE